MPSAESKAEGARGPWGIVSIENVPFHRGSACDLAPIKPPDRTSQEAEATSQALRAAGQLPHGTQSRIRTPQEQ